MNLLGILENGLFALGQVLRFPIFALLWVCVGFAVFYAAAALLEAVARLREYRGFDVDRWVQQGPVLTAQSERVAALPAGLRRMVAAAQARHGARALPDGGLEHLVAEQDEALRQALTGPRALVRIGPSLGLIGTLIPMGGSLAAMAAGNLEAMAGQMVVAFTSTIIGLATGTVAYAILSARQTWATRSIREQRFLAERIAVEMAGG